MIGFTRRVRVFAYAKPADMRKHYDGLYALVVSEMKADPLSGDLFLFTNRRRTRAKALLWDVQQESYTLEGFSEVRTPSGRTTWHG